MYFAYFTTLIALWTLVWLVCYRSFADKQFVVRQLWSVWHYRLLMVAALTGGFALYVCSYPAARRIAKDSQSLRPLMDLYVPAEWVVDNTTAGSGVLQLAEFVGERRSIELQSSRRIERGAWGPRPILSGLSSAVLVVAFAVVPPFLLVRSRQQRNRGLHKDSAQTV